MGLFKGLDTGNLIFDIIIDMIYKTRNVISHGSQQNIVEFP